jgi:hypothetical protein
VEETAATIIRLLHDRHVVNPAQRGESSHV